jgi:glycosyltransferase involved in cell wall biosynthesis
VQVTAIVPRRLGQKEIDELDDIRVLSFRSWDLASAYRLYRHTNADIYHSQEPSFGTYLAMKAMPGKKHVVTIRDPRQSYDWRIELKLPTLNPLQVLSNWLYEDNWLVKQAVQQADGQFTTAEFLVSKAKQKYHLKNAPIFLPTPVDIPVKVDKSPTPLICYVGRWDRRKRPELFFELAKLYPNLRFTAIGMSRDPAWEQHLRRTYGGLPNLKLAGFIDQFRDDDLLKIFEQSWIVVNTSAREGLPNVFLEAAASGCAILSSVDPDGFATRFGYFAREDDFAHGLEELLKNDLWEKCGLRGRQFVSQVFATELAINKHLAIYERLLS